MYKFAHQPYFWVLLAVVDFTQMAQDVLKNYQVAQLLFLDKFSCPWNAWLQISQGIVGLSHADPGKKSEMQCNPCILFLFALEGCF